MQIFLGKLKEAAAVWQNIVGDRPMALSEFSMLKKVIRRKGFSFEEKGPDYMQQLESKFVAARDILVHHNKELNKDEAINDITQ